MNQNRWHIHRAGIVNFWFYDEAEFQLSDGRLILRGANGSGKSVTMQSFLPLVLDGDKRPSRLDPFGSRDRKIEYYLLGEKDTGQNERTGYLYLEFENPEHSKYLTVGIGLRAKKGAASVGFWGFSITDGRRIGHDFFLYHQDDWDVSETKVPLDRASLEAAIGEGGKVVREQGEYQNMVNQLLFGFEDPEAYKELLNLLIQLRSPKLSKDHKPSVIYEILNNALPALGDEDLRPLSEVLEDLDEISDRLDELALHKQDLDTLVRVYDDYNRMRTYSLAATVIADSTETNRKHDEAKVRVKEHEDLNHRVEHLTQQLQQVRQDINEADVKIEAIEKSEVMEKQREYEVAKSRLMDTTREHDGIVKRKDDGGRELQQKKDRLAKVQAELLVHQSDESDWSAQLKQLADETDFVYHEVYVELWKDAASQLSPETWNGLKRDVSSHVTLVKAARDAGVRAERQAEAVSVAERTVSEARALRDQRDEELNERRKKLLEVLEAQENKVLAWHRGLNVLPVAPPYVQDTVRRLQQYPDVSYADVRQPIWEAFTQEDTRIVGERVKATAEKERLEKDRALIKDELEQWQREREPEPPRSDARAKARQRKSREQGKLVGGPLYALCEFHGRVDEASRAAIETALHQAGVLDAWIGPSGWNPGDSLKPDEEEAWLRPNPLLFGQTLAEYLRPTPPEDCGLTAEQIDDVLRTIVMADPSDIDGDPTQMFVTTDGRFQIGPLQAVAAVKPRAEWIGLEARRKTRLATIERLQQEIRELDGQIASLHEFIESLEEQRVRVKVEFDAFPTEEPLRQASDALHQAHLALQHALTAEERADEAYKEARRLWNQLTTKFVECTARFTRLKSVASLEAALEGLRRYELAYRDLKNSFVASARAKENYDTLSAEIEVLEVKLRVEAENLASVTSRMAKLRAEIQTLEQLLTDQGVMAMVAQLSTFKEAREEAKRQQESLSQALLALSEQRGGSAKAAEGAWRALQDAEERYLASAQRLLGEWKFGFVDWPQEIPTGMNIEGHANVLAGAPSQTDGKESTIEFLRPVARAAQGFIRQHKTRYESRNLETISSKLQETFSVASNGLRDYALEQYYDEAANRWFIQSVRDRARPITPSALLAQVVRMEEEQKALISEKDRELYEQILLHSVGRAIRDKINRAQTWVEQMNEFMRARRTSSGLVLSLDWTPKPASSEDELDTDELVALLRRSPETLRTSEIDSMMKHFRNRINFAKELAGDGATLRQSITALLDYRTWFRFTLSYKKGDSPRRELTDSRFNVLSGGEKAMAMYIPLFAATDSRYKDSRTTAPRIVSLDEAFAGVDEQNMSDMFHLLTDMEFDYMMTSQVLWGCYETVPALSIYEVHRPNDANFVTLIPYYWNGTTRRMVMDENWDALREAAVTES